MTRLVLCSLLVVAGCGAGHRDVSDTAPPPPTDEAHQATERHLIYLHGKIIEDLGPRPTHPEFGIYEYRQILDAFAAAGFAVHSEQRAAGTRPAEAADDTVATVRRLVNRGVPPRNITVVGFSKGCAIAVLTALELEEPEVNFVFMACCGPWIGDLFKNPYRTIDGRMLSIYEASDTVGSCGHLFDKATDPATTAEIELHLGGGHGAFYRPHSEWIDPVVRWAGGVDLDPSASPR